MSRAITTADFRNADVLAVTGLTPAMVVSGVQYAYEILDVIDNVLLTRGAARFSTMVELANLSSILGNLLRLGIVRASNGLFVSSGPHKYQDLRHSQDVSKHIEIKIALDTNSLKSHLPKAGYYLTFRYVLCDAQESFTRGTANRGSVISIWEIRFGYLDKEDFNESNTVGDSGKTAPVNARGRGNLTVIYCDLLKCPFAPGRNPYREYAALYQPNLPTPE